MNDSSPVESQTTEFLQWLGGTAVAGGNISIAPQGPSVFDSGSLVLELLCTGPGDLCQPGSHPVLRRSGSPKCLEIPVNFQEVVKSVVKDTKKTPCKWEISNKYCT